MYFIFKFDNSGGGTRLDLRRDAVHVAEELARDDVTRLPRRDHHAVGHDHQPVAHRGGQREVVQHGEHGRAPCIRELADQPVELDDVTDVQMRRGFVEQEDRRVLRQGLRQHDAPALAAGQLTHEPVGQVLHADGDHGVARLGPIFVGARTPPGDVRRATHQHELEHRERERRDHVLRHHRHEPGGLAAAERERIESGQENRADRRLQGPGRHADERGLPAAVRPDQPHDLAPIDGEVDAAQRLDRPVAGVDAGQREGRLSRGHPRPSLARGGAARGRTAPRSAPSSRRAAAPRERSPSGRPDRRAPRRSVRPGARPATTGDCRRRRSDAGRGPS